MLWLDRSHRAESRWTNEIDFTCHFCIHAKHKNKWEFTCPYTNIKVGKGRGLFSRYYRYLSEESCDGLAPGCYSFTKAMNNKGHKIFHEAPHAYYDTDVQWKWKWLSKIRERRAEKQRAATCE